MIALSWWMYELRTLRDFALGVIDGSFRGHLAETTAQKVFGGMFTNVAANQLLHLPLLEHFFYPDPAAVLKAFYSYTRLARARMLLLGGGIHHEAQMLALAIKDESFFRASPPLKHSFRSHLEASSSLLDMVQRGAAASDIPSKLPKASGWYQGIIDALAGIIRRDNDACLRGIYAVFKGHKRLTLGQFAGLPFQLISVYGIALQRIARNCSMDLPAIKHPLNDHLLVMEAAPEDPYLKWQPLPGFNSFLTQENPDIDQLFYQS